MTEPNPSTPNHLPQGELDALIAENQIRKASSLPETVEIGGRKYFTHKGLTAHFEHHACADDCGCDLKAVADSLGITPEQVQADIIAVSRIETPHPGQEVIGPVDFSKPIRVMEQREVVATPESIFVGAFQTIQAQVHDNAKAKGWHEDDRNEAELIALEHAELGEALEFLRHGNPPSDHIPEFSGVEEEPADVIIRIMDHASAKGHRVAEAIIAKMAFNSTRPYKHGKKF